MIKAVIFDVGGVLIRTESHASRRQWERRLGLADWESEQVVFNSEMGQKAQRGEITNAELWQWIGQHLKLDEAGLQAFTAGFWAGDVLDTALIDFIRQLRPQYQTAIISNATDGLRQMLTTQYPLADAFDLIVVSAEEKVMKPNAAIYERTLARLGRQPQEAVFVDDFAHNIEAAQQLGMATIHFRPGTNVPEALAQLGVTV
ncbi:MAG: HAD family phosphatase [Ardenticatenaceae bacterium]|nr:HAD family phosphatase [Ardenticatenaceae bacterium]